MLSGNKNIKECYVEEIDELVKYEEVLIFEIII